MGRTQGRTLTIDITIGSGHETPGGADLLRLPLESAYGCNRVFHPSSRTMYVLWVLSAPSSESLSRPRTDVRKVSIHMLPELWIHVKWKSPWGDHPTRLLYNELGMGSGRRSRKGTTPYAKRVFFSFHTLIESQSIIIFASCPSHPVPSVLHLDNQWHRSFRFFRLRKAWELGQCRILQTREHHLMSDIK